MATILLDYQVVRLIFTGVGSSVVVYRAPFVREVCSRSAQKSVQPETQQKKHTHAPLSPSGFPF
eukprot:SAG31_NODE_38964_length_292_cov_0.414508_1_plen_63_part_10